MRDCVIDISHHNGLHLDFAKTKATGIEAVIHKATQGTRYFDPKFTANREAILADGLLFGAYHFGTGSATGLDQANYFLESVPDGALMALDFEPNPQGPVMTIRQAIEFCAHVESHTQRPITIYTGAAMALHDILRLQSGVFGDRPLWWAAYRATPNNAPKNWPLTMWQYTDHGQVDGIGHCDRSEYFGDDLAALFETPPTPNPNEETSNQ